MLAALADFVAASDKVAAGGRASPSFSRPRAAVYLISGSSYRFESTKQTRGRGDGNDVAAGQEGIDVQFGCGTAAGPSVVACARGAADWCRAHAALCGDRARPPPGRD